MAIAVPAFVQQPTPKYLPPLAAVAQSAMVDEATDAPRPLQETGASDQSGDLWSNLAQVALPYSPDMRRRWSDRSASNPFRSMAGPDDPLKPIYNPRGAPSDAVPAMSQLEARIALEPVFMQHYASTLYALVSRIPTTVAEEREAFDLLA